VAGTFDVAARLAEGRPAVDDLARYASACQALGTCGHGLTDRVERAYDSEAGLDLDALDADHAALRAVVAAVRDAQELQDAQLAALSAAWTGAGADAAAEFLHRHSAASAQAVTALSAAAEQVGSLRDELWRIVDAKVAAAQEVDARTDAVRGEWRAAAETVTSGVGDRATASELVDAHVAPFVEQDVRAEWVSGMEAASAAIAERFDAAIAAVRSEAPMSFSGPGQSWAAAPPSQLPPAAPTAPMTEPAAMAASPVPSAGALPDMGSGLSGLSGASGIGGLGQQLGEMVGGLIPTLGDALGNSELAEPEDALELDPEDDDTADDDDDDGIEKDGTEEDGTEADEETDDEEPGEGEDDLESESDRATAAGAEEPTAAEEPVSSTAEEPAPEPPTPTPAPAPAAPLAVPVVPEPVPAAATPCEIAADEVPQVGE
jgi:hypothetical protein